ncbi:hypothetical protein BDF14DRAFT_1876971 [Spinellus fusiger]|nr:hypothetical protein BDF14DRAFT_1876971 [Spinellus fusiger]
MALTELIKKLPRVSLTEGSNEIELCSHFVLEAKTACRESNIYLICRDLLQVVMFCKDPLDSQKMAGVLGLQIVGRTITFYVLVLPLSGLYIMYEITKVQIPDSLHDLSKLVMDISILLIVLDAFDRVCILSTDPSIINSSLD